MNRDKRPWQELDTRLPTFLKDLDEIDVDIVRMRWLKKAENSDRLWREHRNSYYGFRVPIIVGAATVPVLASLSVPNLATALVGLAVAILTGLDGFFRYGLRWQQARHNALAIEDEGWSFVELAGRYEAYTDHKCALKPFLSNLEAMNTRLGMVYLDLFREGDPAQRKSDPDSGQGTIPEPGSTSDAGDSRPNLVVDAEAASIDASHTPPSEGDPLAE